MRSVGLPALALFCLAFGIAWTASVVVVWKLEYLTADLRPVFRTLFWIGAAALLTLWRRPVRPALWLGLLPIRVSTVAIAAAAFLGVMAWSVLRVGTIASLPAVFSIAPLGLGFVGVFVEELLFRGAIQGMAMERIGAAAAILISSVLFLAVHVPGWLILEIPVTPMLAASVFLIGAVCGILRHVTGSLWPSVAAHWANNLGALL